VSDAFEAAVADAVDGALARWRAAVPEGATRAAPMAVGWTTVEAERAAAEVTAASGAVGPFVDAARDDLLGATCRVTRLALAAVPGVRSLVLLEPSAEGPLAASLARLGEGPAVVWLVGGATAAAMAGGILSAPAAGPFGPERLVLAGGRDGHLLLVVDGAPGTIAT
jgi:hypothetical protein